MSDTVTIAAASFGCAVGWLAFFLMVRHLPGMFSKERIVIAAAAAVGAVLVYVPELVKLLALPEPVGNAVCAAVLAAAAAYKLGPAKDGAK